MHSAIANTLKQHPAWWRWCVILAITGVVSMANMVTWRILNPPLSVPQAPPLVAGLAYNAFQRWDSPIAQRLPDDEALAADMKMLAGLTRNIRTYSATEFPSLPALALEQGMNVMLGVWLDERVDNNALELAAGEAAARSHRNVHRVMVGNETQLHGKLEPHELYSALDHMRDVLDVPVSTAEPWHIWMRQPELAQHVDFITVHLLPYWEGVPAEAAVDEALLRYKQVRERFPKKQIVIGEIGWPSRGNSIGVAHATPERQAAFVRDFLAKAADLPLDYYLMEAIDQPWKQATEGTVGAHWGMMDAARQPKFHFDGPVRANPQWKTQASVATLFGAALMLPFLWAFAGMRLIGRLVFAVSLQVVASFAVMLGTLPLMNYLRVQDAAWMLVLVPALALMAAILLAQLFEFAELFWQGSLQRETPLRAMAINAPTPFVSIHLACCNEPPNMVIATIDSLMALDWPAHEVVVVDNNTADPECWEPVRDHVNRLMQQREQLQALGPLAQLQPNVKFIHLPQWPGFKAGALNVALEQTDPRAEWVAVVDADYQANPQWLRTVMGHGEDPNVAVVQSPQAHRDWSAQPLRRMMNWEYDGFFRIGMHHRHERNAIVQHGTMTLVRATALKQVGGWDEGCICEDSELGLRLLQLGMKVVYVDHVVGTGLVPSDFSAYQRQRRRWALGAVQILRKHKRELFWPRAAPHAKLKPAQRYHFIAGWLPWVGDALHLLFTLSAMVWSVGVLAAPHIFGLPLALFVVPLAVFFTVRLVLVPLLYLRRVPCGARDVLGAATAGMALSHSAARGVMAGLWGKRAVFDVTRKSTEGAVEPPSVEKPPTDKPHRWASVREEGALVVGLMVCLAALATDYLMTQQTSLTVSNNGALLSWMFVLGIQAVPYVAALACVWLSRSPATDAVTTVQASPAGAERRGLTLRPNEEA
jgi:exo-beta-1,3-glucanase (GH17 family)/cellulose synthase/poly-beta-1,6-N-acetylglucosamine synthase-like glycosyltransferase